LRKAGKSYAGIFADWFTCVTNYRQFASVT